MNQPSEFKTVYSETNLRDQFYKFLQVIFHLYPEDKFHQLITSVTNTRTSDEEIYKEVQSKLPSIKPFLSELTFALPALKKQKKEMSREMLKLLGKDAPVIGYLEIGSTGRYISELRKHISLKGPVYLSNDIAPSNAINDMMERGQIGKIGKFIPLNNYQPISREQVPDASLDLVTCLIGLHHCPHELLEGYIGSIHRMLRKGAMFIIRDHDVKTASMATFVSLVHTVFNLGLQVPWETDQSEFKSFKPIEAWSKILCSYGFTDMKKRILQDNDPSDNTLMAFIKI